MVTALDARVLPRSYNPNENIRWLRASRRHPCPVCGHRDWCEISDVGQLVHCMRVPSDKPLRARGGGWLHRLGLALPQVTLADLRLIPNPPVEFKPLTPEQLDELNRELLRICPLSEAHRAYLEAEGVDPQGCGSLAYSQAATVARALVARFGEEICRRHPALREVTSANGKRWWTIASAADGILFPALGVDGLILGLQIRKDKPRGKDDRYRWLSSDGRGGTPLTVMQAAPGAESRHHLIITEGYKKASVAARTWQCHALSLAGVTAYKDSDLLQAVEKLGVQSVSLAFDADKREKKAVREAEQRLLRLLAAALPHLELFYLNWDGAYGKGLDDALKAGAECRFDPATPSEGPRLVTGLPAEVLARAFPGVKPLYTLEEARLQHRALLDRLVVQPDGSHTVITSTTGTGKSKAADDALATALLNGAIRHRVLLLCPDKANIAERTAPGTLLYQALAEGLLVIQRGRNLITLDKPRSSQPEDCANPQAFEAGAARHAAAKFVCKDCPFGSAENWEKSYPGQPRPFKCEEEGYIASRRASHKAQAVLATKDAYLNNSKELDKFDLVICDEELLPHLIESGIRMDTEVLKGWREKIALKELDAPHWQKLFAIIEATLDRLSNERPDLPAGRLLDARATLENEALKRYGFDLPTLANLCLYESALDLAEALRYEAYKFELPYKHNGRLALPYRAATSLLNALADPQQPLYSLKNAAGSFALEIFEARGHLVEALRQKTIVILDSTVPPQLKKLFPFLQEVRFDVPQRLRITQTTNALYSKADLHRPETRWLVARGIAAFARHSQKHLSIVPLRFEEGDKALALPENSMVEHWGRHRATNRYSDCDSLALVGHHLRPIDRIEAEVRAIKAWTGEAEAAPAHAANRLRLYNHLSSYGRAAGRWMQAHSDPDVQAAIEHDYAGHIIQAIGRLRAALRPAHLPPVEVLILCNEPVADLQIDELTGVRQLIATDPAESPDFTYISHEKKSENEQSVPAIDAKTEAAVHEQALAAGWDRALIQDETARTQTLEDFLDDLTNNLSGPDPWDDFD
ncbi:MAG TPA: DUF3854 domain-containing protein [Chloroflexia bacterium]|nr:DUF3854 domain-containing protein [Chloroflexia bacterium]